MQGGFAHLALVPRVREGFGEPASGEPYKRERRFLDFVINGVSLYDTIGSPRDLVSVLWDPPQVLVEADRAVRRLLLIETGERVAWASVVTHLPGVWRSRLWRHHCQN